MANRILFLFVLNFITNCAWADSNFWDVQRKGTNAFNNVERFDRLRAADNFGFDVIRMTFTKWKSASNSKGGFLFGSPNKYQGLNEQDLKVLVNLLDQMKSLKIRVVLTPLALPGSQWRQYNGNKNDVRLWEDFKFQNYAIQFWRDLALRLKGHPSIAAFNIINEPMPEFATVRFEDWSTDDISSWCKKIENTPQDLNQFYSKAIRAIREVNPSISIVLDSGFYANAWMLQCLKKQEDTNVLYSFHMYEPYLYSNYRNTREYRYPGVIPWGERGPLAKKLWDKAALEKYFIPVDNWAKENGIPKNRIYVAEFGVNRKAPGAVQYFQDLLSIIDSRGWHWGFYSFREDGFPAMDYEMGPKESLPEDYWKAEDRGEFPSREKWYRKNPMWNAVLKKLKK